MRTVGNGSSSSGRGVPSGAGADGVPTGVGGGRGSADGGGGAGSTTVVGSERAWTVPATLVNFSCARSTKPTSSVVTR